MRCLALAQALASRGWTSTFACTPETVATAPALVAAGHRIVELPGGAIEPAVGRIGPCELLVVDHYGLDATFEAACRPWAQRILVIDDLANRPHDCDLLLDQTFGRDPGLYRSRVMPACLILAGSNYALLRPEFSVLREATLARRREIGKVERILVSMGLTDSAGASLKAIEGMEAVGVKAAVDVVLGRTAPMRDEIEARAALAPDRLTVHVDVAHVAALTAKADLAIGAAGTTTWERCCLGLPTIMVVAADNQRDIAEGLTAVGAAVLVGTADDVSPAVLGRSVKRLMGDPLERIAMAAAAAAVCDGLGATRVVAEIESLLPSKPR